MARQAVIRKTVEGHRKESRWRDFILGWQDGLVNVLGVILGVAAATNDTKIVIIAGMAATFAESISMMAVAYTSFKAEQDFYKSELAHETRDVCETPAMEKGKIRAIFRRLGFTGSLLDSAVRRVTSDKKRWVGMLMETELKLSPPKHSPFNIAMIVGASAFIGSFIPLIPFVLLPVKTAIYTSIIVAAAFLFVVGAYKAKTTVGSWLRGGLELTVIGMLAALAGYGIGALMGAVLV
jgi:VIT1/CCC1 family predicted Fe2+/Mn2+ transporter